MWNKICKSLHDDLHTEVLIRLSSKYWCSLCGISLEGVEGHFIVVVGLTDHKRAALGCWQDCWLTQHDRKAITNLIHIVFLYYVTLLLDYRKFLIGKISQPWSKLLGSAEIFRHLTYSTTTHGQYHCGWGKGQQFCNSWGEILRPLLAGCFCSFPGACETNTTPGVVQAKLISHLMLAWL